MPLPLSTVLIAAAFLIAAFHGSALAAAVALVLAFVNECIRAYVTTRIKPSPNDGTYTIPARRQPTPIGDPEDIE